MLMSSLGTEAATAKATNAERTAVEKNCMMIKLDEVGLLVKLLQMKDGLAEVWRGHLALLLYRRVCSPDDACDGFKSKRA